jgi:GNAT superfamily N-acetyltransferase
MIKLRDILNEANSTIGEVASFEKLLQTKYSHVLDGLSFYYDAFSDGIFISDIYIKEQFRRQGWGSKIMKEIVDFADKKNMPISLIPVADGIPTHKLIKFYKQFGFIENAGNALFDDMSMYRLPHSV